MAASPHLRFPFSGVPIIKISVYREANSHRDDARRLRELPVPGKDTPQQVFGFRQPESLSDGFKVVNARINQTRHWTCSSATFSLAASFDRYSIPKMPPVRPEDVVQIEIGYAPSLRVGLKNPGIWMRPVFYGIVDVVKERGGTGDEDGVVLTVTARDPLRYLVDNKIRGQYLKTGGVGRENRGYAVADLLWMGSAIDHIEFETQEVVNATSGVDQHGNKVALGRTFTLDQNGHRIPLKNEHNMLMEAAYGPDNSYLRLGVIEPSERADLIETEGNTLSPGIAVMDRFPIDLIKHLSLVETNPRELWTSPEDGSVNWTFRRTDLRRLMHPTKPEIRAMRQYYYRLPANKANIIAYTNEWTTAGTVSHFTISNGQAHGAGTAKVTEHYAESPMAKLPDPHRKGRKDSEAFLRQFTRQRYVYDDTMGESEQFTVLANALYTIWGKDIQTGMIHVIGDPTLTIGEGIQLFNTGLFGRRMIPKNGTPDGEWIEDPDSPPGVYRIEGLQHLFATGGVNRGYTSVVIFSAIDPPAKQIRTNEQAKAIRKLDLSILPANN